MHLKSRASTSSSPFNFINTLHVQITQHACHEKPVLDPCHHVRLVHAMKLIVGGLSPPTSASTVIQTLYSVSNTVEVVVVGGISPPTTASTVFQTLYSASNTVEVVVGGESPPAMRFMAWTSRT